MTAALMRERETPGVFFLLYFFNIFTRPPPLAVNFIFLPLSFSLSPYTVSFRTSQLLCVCVFIRRRRRRSDRGSLLYSWWLQRVIIMYTSPMRTKGKEEGKNRGGRVTKRCAAVGNGASHITSREKWQETLAAFAIASTVAVADDRRF